jgi:membrane protein DedA with SNARE-associated domain
VIRTVLSYGLPIVALTLLFSAAGIPTGVPIHVVLLLAGAYLIGSLPGLAVAILAMAAAELAGTLLLHLIARTGGVRLLERMASDRQDRVQATFDRWRGRLGGRDVAVITMLRLIPFVRMGTTVGTGLLGIRLRDFVIGAGVSAVIWTALPLSIGYAFRSHVTTIEGYYHSILDALPVALGIASLIVVVSVLAKSPAMQAQLREMVAPVWTRVRPPAVSVSLPEISQEPPPALN